MFNDKKKFTPFLLKMQTPWTNNNFNLFSNYFFLTNNYNLLNVLTFFFMSTNDLCELNIKKNIFFFFKLSNQHRKYFYNKNYLFKNKFKFNKYFIYSFLSKSFKKKNLNLLLFKNSLKKFNFKFFFFNNHKIFFKNWHFLLGNLISPYYWDLYKNKTLFKKNLTISFFKNNLYFNKNFKFFKNKSLLNINYSSVFLKKIYLNNYFYLKKFNINYNKFNFLFKINQNLNIKNNYDWFFSKPYTFLNSYEFFKSNNIYSNHLSLIIYKNYLKFFNIFKKFNYSYRLKSTTNILFKNFFNFYKILPLNPHRSLHFLKLSFFNYFSFFKFNNFFCSKKIIKKKKLLKKKIKFILFVKYYSKTKLYRKYKFFFNLNIFNKHIKLKKIKKFDIKFFSYSSFKLTKRIKKLNICLSSLRSSSFTKTSKSFWLKKSFSNNLFYLTELNYKSKTYYLNSRIINFKKKLFKNFIYLNKFKKINKNKTNFVYPPSSYVFTNLKKSIFFSKERTAFIASKYGFFFTTDNFNISAIKTYQPYNLKKLMYSFSYKNEIQRFILKKYTRLKFLSNGYNNNPNNNVININNNENSLFGSYDFNFFNSFFTKKHESFFLLNQNFFHSSKWVRFKTQLNYSRTLFNDESNFLIKRIRFKPGYMNLWREARNVLKTSLSLNFKYQKKLTNYLSKYNKFINFKTFLVSEMCLLNLLIRSRFIPDHSLSRLYIQNNLVYLNGISCSNPNLQVFVGDFIQLIVSLKYYILYKWFLNLSLKKKIKIKKLSQKKSSVSFENDEKKRSFNLPNWLLFNKNLLDDVAKYLEVDYMSLSAIILYEPFLWTDINAYNLIDQRFGVINLYNWKYIT